MHVVDPQSSKVYFQKRRSWYGGDWRFVRRTGNDPVRGGMPVCLRCCSNGAHDSDASGRRLPLRGHALSGRATRPAGSFNSNR